MTFLGKLLVLVNLVISLMLATFALGMFTNRIDWPDKTAKTGGSGASQGVLSKKKAELAQWRDAMAPAYTRWQELRKAVLEEEAKQPEDRKWYQEQMGILETGKNSAGAEAPIQTFKYMDKTLVLDDKGRPKLEPIVQDAKDSPVKCAVAGKADWKEVVEEIQETEKNILAKLEEQEKLSGQVNGGKGELGLRVLLEEQERAARAVSAEIDYLRPQRVNRQAEADVLLRRTSGLERRVEELQNKGRTVGRP